MAKLMAAMERLPSIMFGSEGGAYCSPAYYQEAAPRMVTQRREGTVGKSAVSPKRKGRTPVLRQNAIESERDWITGVYTHNLGQ
jgi:hypothetical protein